MRMEILIVVVLGLSVTSSNTAFLDQDAHIVGSWSDVEDTSRDVILLPDGYQTIKKAFGFHPEDAELTLSNPARRKRRNVGGIGVQGLSASQTCEGITLEWLPLSIPYSPEFSFNHSEFKHYNVYRNKAYFDDVTGMKPYASGSIDPRLRSIQTTQWLDHYPTENVDWFYAVTVVNGKGREEKGVDPVKAQFKGGIKIQGKPFLMIPTVLRGRAMHHSVIYNERRNEYLVTFDWDANYDGTADHLYALRLNQAARIVDKTVLNITANIPGWIGGDEGWPSAAFNPIRNEYLVLFHLRSKAHFNNRYVIIGQRLFADKTERSAAPSIVAKFGPTISGKQPKILFNPNTGGYVASLIAEKPSKDTVALFLNHLGQVVKSLPVCSFKTDSYEHNVFLDTKRLEFYFTCSLERRGANADFELKNKPFLVLMTKMNATGGHAANTGSPDTKSLIGYSAKRYTRHEGYYNEKTDRLVLFWEDMKNGLNTISSASVIMTRQFFIRDPKKYRCPTTREVKTPVALPMAITGGHYLIWQERSRFSWNIGGYLMKGNFRLRSGVQKYPAVTYNSIRGAGFAVWQEDFGREIRLIGRHFVPLSSHSCSPSCSAKERCAAQDTCTSTSADRCATKNGGCSHVCTNMKGGDRVCSCPDLMKLEDDKKTCKSTLVPCQGMTPLKNALGTSDLFCGRGRFSIDCPVGSYCHVHPTDAFAKCCPDLLPEYTGLIASQGVLWRVTENQKKQTAQIERMPFTQGLVIVAVGYDPQDKRIYWSDVGQGVIKRAYMDGSGEETILPFVQVPDGLCLDVEGREIYWTDTGFDKIEKAALDGSSKQTLIASGLDQPRAIVLYKKKRQMFWTDWGKAAKIERASMDGTNRKTIITGGLGWPNGFVIDEIRGVLYWADAQLDKIETSDLEGGNRRVLVDESVTKHPFSLAILNNRLFWTDWERAGLQSIDKNTGKDLRQSFKGFMGPKGLLLFFTKSRNAQKCLDPGVPQNGGRHPSPDSSGHYPTKSKVIFTCRPGYKMIGPAERKCLSSGKWSKKVTLCKAPPVLTASPLNKTINEGESVVLKCSASVLGKRIPVVWFKNNVVLSISKSGDYFVASSGHLVFLNAHFADRGMYKCVAMNEAGRVTGTAYLGVRAKIKLRECGRPRYQTRARIIGGRRADRGAHPWQVMLWNNRKNNHFCGGTLITDRWVVTAAHCVSRKFDINYSSKDILVPSDIRLRFGKYVRLRKERNEQSIDADMIIVHPSYDSNTYDSDIALIRTAKKVIFTDYIQPICLPSSKSDFQLFRANTTGVISGWGSRKDSKSPLKFKAARRLHEANVPIVSQAKCIASHPSYIVTVNMFCAGRKNSSSGDACQGDSGGPLSVNNPEVATPSVTRHVLLGVISWGDGCGKYGKYGVYTRLTSYVDWIISQTVND